tara:strand:+ start:6099 stop:6563 length:465 start_codon:yes stop_codon:yes gene_type:complete
MSELVFEEDALIGGFVAQGLYDIDCVKDFGKFVTIGVRSKGKIVAGAVFNNYRVHDGIPFDIQIAFYTASPVWATRSNMEAILRYPFDTLKLKRITAVIKKSNKKVKKLISSLGFQYEGKVRLGWDGKADAYVYGLLQEEAEMCIQNLKENQHG